MTDAKSSYVAGVMANLKMPLAWQFFDAAVRACSSCSGRDVMVSATPGLLGIRLDAALESARFSVDFAFDSRAQRDEFMATMSACAEEIGQEDGVAIVMAGNVLANARIVEALNVKRGNESQRVDRVNSGKHVELHS